LSTELLEETKKGRRWKFSEKNADNFPVALREKDMGMLFFN
jgi:hypothetical protein